MTFPIYGKSKNSMVPVTTNQKWIKLFLAALAQSKWIETIDGRGPYRCFVMPSLASLYLAIS